MTGALIRDFFKQYRELRYTNQGSIGLSEIEKNAYRLALTLEITHLDAPRYSNLKTLPENTHFGYATLFRGSTVTDTVAIKYPKFRVFDIINQGIWEYHQATESQQLGASVVQLSVEENGRNIWDLLGEGAYSVVRIFALLVAGGDGLDPSEQWVLDAFPPGNQPEEYQEFDKFYRGFPVASPFPDTVKFKSDVPCSFLWRLEAWFLVNPVVYIADSPTDSGDETEGEDEYPQPNQGDGDGDGSEFPRPSAKDVENDPRDYGTSNEPPPFEGGQCATAYDVTVVYSDVLNGTPRGFSRTLRVPGPVGGLGPFSETDGELSLSAGGQKYRTGLVSYPFPCSTSPGSFSGCQAKITSVVRVDGAPDNCGDPPQGIVGTLT